MSAEPLINSSMLSQHIGRLVTVIGKITYLSPTGNELKLQLPDGKEVTVALQDPLNDALEGFMEITAKVEHNGSLLAEKFISFGDADLDLGLLNEAINTSMDYPKLFPVNKY